jgi:hypothetical protein
MVSSPQEQSPDSGSIDSQATSAQTLTDLGVGKEQMKQNKSDKM